MNHTIDSVRVFNRALTPIEVTSLFSDCSANVSYAMTNGTNISAGVSAIVYADSTQLQFGDYSLTAGEVSAKLRLLDKLIAQFYPEELI